VGWCGAAYNRLDWMGQINCQCQYIPSDEFDSFKRANSLHNLPSRALEPRTQVTRMTLKNGPRNIDIRLGDYSRSTFGSGEECEQRPEHLNGNSFKLELRIRSRCVYMRDCGVGLGAFLLKRKIIRRADGAEMLLNACDKWLLLKITHAEQVHCSLYDSHTSTSTVLERKEEHEIDLGVEKLLVRREREGKNYVVRRGDRREMWVWLGEERRVRSNDVVRLGFEFYEVDSISSHFDTLKKQ
jgi:hypothetical protein